MSRTNGTGLNLENASPLSREVVHGHSHWTVKAFPHLIGQQGTMFRGEADVLQASSNYKWAARKYLSREHSLTHSDGKHLIGLRRFDVIR